MEHITPGGGRTVATTVRLPAVVWSALRQLAEQRALAGAGRPSLSAVVAALVEAETKRQVPRAV